MIRNECSEEDDAIARCCQLFDLVLFEHEINSGIIVAAYT